MQIARRTQAERRRSTRQLLLDAALAHLVEGGMAGFITPAISRRAGVSQGALFKHFPTKAALLSATTAYLFAQLLEEYEVRFRRLGSAARTVAASIDLLWDVMDDPRLAAAYEVFTAARNASDLQAALAPVVATHGEHLGRLARSLFPGLVELDPVAFDATVEVATFAMQGLVLEKMAGVDGTARDRVRRTLAEFARIAIHAAGAEGVSR